MASKPTEEQIQKEFERLSRDAQSVSVHTCLVGLFLPSFYHHYHHLLLLLSLCFVDEIAQTQTERVNGCSLTHTITTLPYLSSRVFLEQVAIKIGELESDLKEHE